MIQPPIITLLSHPAAMSFQGESAGRAEPSSSNDTTVKTIHVKGRNKPSQVSQLRGSPWGPPSPLPQRRCASLCRSLDGRDEPM